MGRCRRHPHHSVVGVCAHCLNDRLLALMEEEDDEELLFDMSPHDAFYTYMPPSSCTQAQSFSNHGVAGTPTLARRASMDYNRAHVKQMAASYLHKHHHSLSSSPQLHPSNATNTKPSQRPRPPFDTHPPLIAEQITRKKRPSLWSLLLRHKDASKRQSLNAYNGEHVHLQRDEFTGIVKVHRIGARAEEASGAVKQRLNNNWNVDGNSSDCFVYASKPSFSSRRSEGHENLSKNDASSLLNSPNFMASPSRQAGHLFPSPISKYTSPSPGLKKETRERASPGRQVPVSYGLSRHVEHHGMSAHVQDDDSSRPSWISSLFPRRHRRSNSISSSDVASFSQASYLHSVGVSPDSGARGRRKSVSFLDDESHESRRRYIAAKLSQSNGIGIGFKTPEPQHRHVYDHPLGTRASTAELRASKQLFKSPKSISHGALQEIPVGQEHSLTRGRSVSELAANLSSPTILKADLMSSKSPRAKLVSFLNKRKNGTVSIDCGRDVRVSPVPMLRVKRDYLNHRDLLDAQDLDLPSHGDPQGLDGLHRHLKRNDGFHGHAEYCVEDSKFKEEHQKSSMAVVKETLKSPRLMSLQAMKQLLKSPRLAPVRTSKRDPEDDDGKGWSKAFSKTLSPMLGHKLKKKPSIRKHDFVHDGYVHTPHRSDRQQSDESPVSRGRLNVQCGSPYQNGNQFSVPKHRLHRQYGNGFNRGDELLVRETRVLPALDEKGPPQQYSFLSKDYSAFSFYFSPRRTGSIDSATRTTPKKSSVW